MNDKVNKLKLIVLNGEKQATEKTNSSLTLVPYFDFDLIDVNNELKNSIVFDSINEAVIVFKEAGVTANESEIKNTLLNKTSNINSNFRLRFF
jgi:hypothetical protein